jgi:hypothetical protein
MKNRDIIGEIVMVIVIVSILLSFMVIYSSNVDRMVFKYTESYQNE